MSVTGQERMNTVNNSQSRMSAEDIYRQRDEQIATLEKAGHIGFADIQKLERGGRCIVATYFWNLCDEPARDSLLSDQHAHVRSCADLSAKGKGGPGKWSPSFA